MNALEENCNVKSGIVIGKVFRIGGCIIRNLGYHVESLAIIDAMDADITFRE